MNPIIRDRARAVTAQVRHDGRLAAPSLAHLVRSMSEALAGTGRVMGLRAAQAWHTEAPSGDVTHTQADRTRCEREGVAS